ncbi:glycoside hydrolase family 172 protein [Poriferisphaera corsica]|nr:glycoside hydrolase family 172 protein [Poriferisphaera corsica]
MGNLANLSRSKTRSITPENMNGEKAGGARAEVGEGSASDSNDVLGKGWKVNPYIHVKSGEIATIAEINESGTIQHIWMTPTGHWKHLILRIYWDDQAYPSVECPLGDFFANGWQDYGQVNSLTVNVNPASGLNCFWPMPFKKCCRMTVENMGDDQLTLFYQITYAVGDVSDDVGYFHAYYNQSRPVLKGDVHTILKGVKGWGQYVGTYITWQVNEDGWWGEGEVKFYMDGDEAYPTICGTGLEDYFLGSYNFDAKFCSATKKGYQAFTGPYAGMPQVIRPDGEYMANQRFGLYRWHVPDPIRFEEDLKVTVQSLGWRKGKNSWGHRYAQRQDHVTSVAYWYQTLPSVKFPELPSKDDLEIVGQETVHFR